MNARKLIDRAARALRECRCLPAAAAVVAAVSLVALAGKGTQALAADPAATAAATRVAFDTSEGRIVVELRADKAPKTAANFLQYVNEGFYDGTIFHRVIDGFMIQGGGFTPGLSQKPTRPPIASESTNGLKNVRGAIAMARTSDPNSATSQFFINVVDNNKLDYPSFDGTGYTVFGNVVQGMDVVDKIRVVPVGQRGPYGDVPVTAVVIKTAHIVK
ncbi:MAG: peptidyl-prolyl cis-trans isomerase [Burkholderiaceae bacterium]|nr:peptidyl-prolyl cis-trans isomerase [Burkholderiaceae bacterium]